MTSPDPVLSMAGAIGLGASLGTALVVDLADEESRPGQRTLRDIVEDGPSMRELSPGRPGVALVRGGGIEPATAIATIEELSLRWPALVIRTPLGRPVGPTVPAMPLYPGTLLRPPDSAHCVWQPVGAGSDPPAPGPVLPRIRPATLQALLSGRLPRRSRWVSAWRQVWEMPWA